MYGNILILVNPTARSGKAAKVAAQMANTLNRIKTNTPREIQDYSFYYTVQPNDACRITQEKGAQYNTIVVIGGDGTVNETVNGLMTLPRSVRPKLGLIPCGNGDDFARSIHIPRSPEKALQQFESGILTPKHSDVGRANNHWFIETLSFGLDAAIALGTQELRKRTKRTGTSLYLQCGIDQLKNHRTEHRLTASFNDEEPEEILCYLLAIQNGLYYGGGFMVCPQAKINDGLFDICYATPTMSFSSAAHLFMKAHNGNHINNPHIHFRQAKKIQLTLQTPLPSQIDGERFEANTVLVEVFPSELEVLMP